MISYGLLLCDRGQKDRGYSICNGRGKQDQRKDHTGQDTVDRQGRAVVQSVKAQMPWNQYRLNTVQNIYQKAAAGQGKREDKDFF